MRLLLNEIIVNQRRSVVELGGGISTVFMAKTLSDRGGTLLTVEEDADWLAQVGEMVRLANIGPGTWQGLHAAMAPCSTSVGGSQWYEEDTLNGALGNRKFDMCLVDGPCATVHNVLCRFPAGAFIANYLSEDYALFVDDVDRAGELRIARSWAKDMGGTLRIEQGGIGLIHPVGSTRFNIY
jgi:predicted O-methyltransferase YrrM